MTILRDNPLKAKLAAGESLIGCWSQMVSPIAAEVVALVGYDFVLVDNEHGPGSILDTVGIMQAASAQGAATVMRVPWNDFVYLKRALDTGIEGVMIPAVNTAEEARNAVAACRYPPGGVRGVAYTVTRCSDYGLRAAEYAEKAADNLIVMCQVESKAAVDNIAEIGAVEGIDILFIGPFDLSASIGKAGRFDDPEVAELIDRAEAGILAGDKAMAGIPKPGDSARAMLDRGYRVVVSGSDLAFLRDAARADLAALRGG